MANFKDSLRRHLDSSTNKSPNEIIQSWQAANSIRVESLDAALPLLDRVKIRRFDFYQSTADILRERLLGKIQELAATGRRSSYKRMAELLEASFGYINVPALRPVPMRLLEYLSTLLEMHKPAVRPRLREKYLKTIVSSKELYASAPVAVKRHIWEEDPKLFLSEISPLFDEYIRGRTPMTLYADMELPAMSVPAKIRRQAPAVQQLVQLIGTSSFLYEHAVSCLRDKYKSTGDPAVCTLRMDLLMALHDAKIDDVCVRDLLHKFAWVLDACSRDQVAEARRLNELRGFYKTAKANGGPEVASEIALLCACPHVQATLSLCLLSQLDHLLAGGQLPRADPICVFLLRLLQLGLSAWELSRVDGASVVATVSDSVAACELLPRIARLRLETQLRLVAKQTRRLIPAALVNAAVSESAPEQQKPPVSAAATGKAGGATSSNQKSKKAGQKHQIIQQQSQPAALVVPPSEESLRSPALPLVCARPRVGRLLARYHCVHLLRDMRRTAPDVLQVSCDLLLDLLDPLSQLDEDFEPMPLQWIVVQLCHLREAPAPSSFAASASASNVGCKTSGPGSSAAPPPIVPAGPAAVPVTPAGAGPAGVASSQAPPTQEIDEDAESCRQLDRCLQILCSRLLAPRAAKQPLTALFLSRCAAHLPVSKGKTAASAAAAAATAAAE